MDLTQLITQHGAASWDKQMCINDLIGDNTWNLNLERGLMSFGDEMTFPVQILGSEAEYAGTWLWAWANEAGNFSPAFTTASRQLQDFGRQNLVPELTTPEISGDDANGHLLSLIALGLCGTNAYCRVPCTGGAAFLLLTVPETRCFTDLSPAHFIRIFMDFTSQFECSHRPALEAYARYKSYTVAVQEDRTLLLASHSGEEITAVFDDVGSLWTLKARLTPNSPDGDSAADV